MYTALQWHVIRWYSDKDEDMVQDVIHLTDTLPLPHWESGDI